MVLEKEKERLILCHNLRMYNYTYNQATLVRKSCPDVLG